MKGVDTSKDYAYHVLQCINAINSRLAKEAKSPSDGLIAAVGTLANVSVRHLTPFELEIADRISQLLATTKAPWRT
jgi:hypothetical protein